MTQPRSVSIVVPCYNTERFLAEALQTSLDQTHPPLEIIVVDDGSTDGSAKVAAQFPTVRYIHQKNQGVSAARNTGFRECRGEFVIFHDADDRLAPDALEIGIRAHEQHPGCGFVYGFSQTIDPQGRFQEGQIHGKPIGGADRMENAGYASLLAGNGMVPPAVAMFRRAVLEKVGCFDPNLRLAEDHDVYLRVAREFPIFCHNTIVLEYRHHDNNTSRKNTALMLKLMVKVLEEQRDWIRGKPELEHAAASGRKYWATILGPALAGEMVGCLKRGKFKQSMLAASMLLQHYPRGIGEYLAARLRRPQADMAAS